MSKSTVSTIISQKRDLYSDLGLNHDATPQSICSAYRKLAPKYKDSLNDRKAFEKISEAYYYLSKSRRKEVYDIFGYRYLQGGYNVSTKEFDPKVEKYHEDADRVFYEFFGGDHPFEDLYDPLVIESSYRFTGIEGRSKKQNPDSLKSEFYVTLEEIFYGCNKKIKLSRRVLKDKNESVTKEEDTVISIDVKPGTLDGTTFLFRKMGNEAFNQETGDLELTLKTRPHPVFKRVESDLEQTFDISLQQAMIGFPISIHTLDERELSVNIIEVVTPSYVKSIVNEGLPLPNDPSEHGRLYLKFTIHWPRTLTEKEKYLAQLAFQRSHEKFKNSMFMKNETMLISKGILPRKGESTHFQKIAIDSQSSEKPDSISNETESYKENLMNSNT